MTLTETLDRLPPCLCRMAARDPERKGRRKTLAAISRESGLSYGSVRRLSLKDSFDNTPPKIIERFTLACGVNILHPKRTIEYLKRALKTPNGYKLLAAPTGHHSPRAVIEMLKGLRR